MSSVVLIVGLAGVCLCDELGEMAIDDIENANIMIIVKILDSNSKKSRRFVIVDEENGLHKIITFKKYVAL